MTKRAMMLVFMLASSMYAAELITNGSFEVPDAAGAKDWTAVYGGYTASPGPAGAEQKSILIDGGTNKLGIGGAMQNVRGFKQGAVLKITSRIYIEEFSSGIIKPIHLGFKSGGKPFFALGFKSGGKPFFPHVNLVYGSSGKYQMKQWLPYELTLDLSKYPDVEEISVYCLSYSHGNKPFKGKVYFTDVSVQDVEKESAPTKASANEQTKEPVKEQAKAPATKSAKGLALINGDFDLNGYAEIKPGETVSGWTASADNTYNAKMTIAANNAGAFGLEMTANQNKPARISQQLGTTPEGLKEITLTGFVKKAVGSTPGVFTVGLYAGDWPMVEKTISPTDAFQQFTFKYPAIRAGISLNLRFTYSGSGNNSVAHVSSVSLNTGMSTSSGPIADMWVYDPFRVELGDKPVKKFEALKKSNSPLLAMAKRYNELLVKSAFMKEDVRRLARARYYAGLPADESLSKSDGRLDEEETLAKLYAQYGEAYASGTHEQHAERFYQAANRLNAELDNAQARASKQTAAIIDEQKASGKWLPPCASAATGPLVIRADGKSDRLIFADGAQVYHDLDESLRLDPLIFPFVGAPKSAGRGEYDWSAHENNWNKQRKLGNFSNCGVLLHLELHYQCYTPPWLWKELEKDPEIVHPVQNAEVFKIGERTRLNWWHPLVQDYGREIVENLGNHYRNRNDISLYLYQWENKGPNVTTAKGTRQVGYGKYATTAFRDYLKGKYKDIGKLNSRWGSSYAAFDAINPPPDKFVTERRRAQPLAGEWEAWREQSYTDWCKLLYQSWKKADPNKPIMTDNYLYMIEFSMPNVYDTCDIAAFHYGMPRQMLGIMLLNSISRYNGNKPIAMFENQWGVRDHERMYEELPKRHSAQHLVSQYLAWGCFMQFWNSQYSTMNYILQYDCNRLDPSYAITTLRYRTGGLPAYFEKYRRMQGELLDSQVTPSRICLLSPSASIRCNFPNGASGEEMLNIYTKLYPSQYLFEVVPEEYFLDGRADLGKFDVLILPYALYLAEDLQRKIATWLRDGSRLLVSSGPFGLYDDIGCNSGTLFKQAFAGVKLKENINKDKSWSWETDAAPASGILTANVGKSKIMTFLQPGKIMLDRPDVKEKLLAAIENATDRAAYDVKNSFEIVAREQGDTRLLCINNPDLDKAVSGTIHVKGAYTSVVDLDYEKGYPVPAKVADGETLFPLRLAPGEGTVIRLTKLRRPSIWTLFQVW